MLKLLLASQGQVSGTMQVEESVSLGLLNMFGDLCMSGEGMEVYLQKRL